MSDRPQDHDLDDLLEAEPVTDPSDDSVSSSIQQENETSGGDDVSGLPDHQSGSASDGRASCRWCRDEFQTLSSERLHDCDGRRRAKWDVGREAPVIEPQTDEIKGFLLFAGDGLAPYFGLTSEPLDIMLNNDVRFEFQGDEWCVEHVDYHDGGIDGRPGDVFDKFQEGEINLVQDDGNEKRHLTLQFAPRFPGMESDGESVSSVPDDIPEGLNFHFHSAMLDPDEILGVIRAWADVVDLNPTYFIEDALSLDHCTVYQTERYVRIGREHTAGTVVGADGILDRLQRFSRLEAGRGKARWDNTEVLGGNNATALSAEDWQKLCPGQARAKQVKHYHPKHVRNQTVESDDDPLADPKVGCLHGTEHSEPVPWEQLDGLIREIDDALLNVLHWSDLPINPNPDIYTADDYFDVVEYDRDPRIIEDPTPAVEAAEEDIAVRSAIATDLGPAEQNVLQALTDGGDGVHYNQLAERADTGSSTVYRFFDKMSSVLSRTNGRFSFADDVVRDKFEQLMEMLHDAAEYADRSLRRIARDERDYTLEDSPFAAWMRRYGVSWNQQRDRDQIELTFETGRFTIDEIRRKLRAGLEAARDTSSHLTFDLIAGAIVTYTDADGQRRTVNPFQQYGSVTKVLGRFEIAAGV